LSTITPFPGLSRPKDSSQEDFEREVASRFGLLPNFFKSTPDAPLVIRELWLFAKSAYLDTPIPTLFKERLFVYLSRFCEVRYCITRALRLPVRTRSVRRRPGRARYDDCPGGSSAPAPDPFR
jgi:hypothetical protein